MALQSPSSSSSPSSSAVTLPRPGKSILKKPPPPQQSFFSLSRLSRLLPTQNASSSSSTSSTSLANPDTSDLKRAHFFLPSLVTVYPISTATPPCGPNVREEKKNVEVREAERRRRIVRGNSYGSTSNSETEEWWSMDRVESFYQECCVGREEQPHPGISAAFKKASGASGRIVDLSGVQLTPGQAATLSDVFSVEWGLRKLFLKECELDEHILKPMLHALTIPGTLNFLSVVSNRKLKAPSFKLVGAFVKKCSSLQFLDLSQNFLDKKSVEYIGAALCPANENGLVSLRMDDCSLRPAALEALAQAVRTSSLRNVSLRHNRISASGAVALALMIKDYPDTMPTSYSSTVSNSSNSSLPGTPTSSLFNALSPPPTPTTASPPLTPTRQTVSLPNSVPPPPPRTILAPPPTHPSLLPVQTTYTPYVPRRRGVVQGATATARAVQHATLSPNPLSASGQPVPVITSSAQGGVTMRHPVSSAPVANTAAGHGLHKDHSQGPSAALLDKVRALDSLPRLGELRTLDLRGNDIRTGIQYIAQVLKRNRTLKVLNLSENKIDVQGLVAIAESLKYNLTLETLDLSRNPCSGPGLEGIQSLRTAFTLNTSLKRLFLASTSLTSAGAIALAEFLPESTSLLHLDLTLNNLDLAGVMALSEGLKANHTMRCLDLNIPPDDEEFARMCRDILNTCVRNTEEAERNSQTVASGRGQGKGVWGLIEESELAKTFKKDDGKKVEGDYLSQAKECEKQLQSLLSNLKSRTVNNHVGSATPANELLDKAKAIQVVLADVIQGSDDPSKLEELFLLNDSITSLVSQIGEVQKASVPNGLGLFVPITSQASKGDAKSNGTLKLYIPNSTADAEQSKEIIADTPKVDKGKGRAEPEPEVFEKVLSPSFMITGSDDEDDEEGKIDEPDETVECHTPLDLSKHMVEEEGEIFRKGTVLLGPEEMEGEYDGEELRIELLEAEVERPPPRAVNVDEFGVELPPLPMSPVVDIEKALSPTSPQDTAKPPRPYLRRTRSSSSSILQASPTAGKPSMDESAIKGVQSPDIATSGTPLSPIPSQAPAGSVPYLARRRSSSPMVSSPIP